MGMDSNDVAKLMASNLVKDGNSKENKDFLFGLIHHAIRGVAGVAPHAIHAVRGLGHAILGDEEQKDFAQGLAKQMEEDILQAKDSKARNDFIFGLIHHAIRGAAGVAHHAIHAVRGLGHAILGDEEINDMAKKVMDELVKDGLKVNDNDKDFFFGLIHHAIRGVVGVAHHAIHAVRGLGHVILGDEEQKDYYYGYGYGHPYYHHHYYHHHYYGDNNNNNDYYYGYGHHPYYHHGYYHHVYYGDNTNNDGHYGDV